MEKECQTRKENIEYQVNNKFEKIFIKSCKKMKGKEKKTKGSEVQRKQADFEKE